MSEGSADRRPGRASGDAALCAAIGEAANLLPGQAPLHAFVHHNTLHHFEDLPFNEALAEASRHFQSEQYLPLQAYLDAHAQGSIAKADLAATLEEALGDRAHESLEGTGFTRLEVWHRLLEVGFEHSDTAEVHWRLQEDVRLRDRDALWQSCLAATPPLGRHFAPPSPVGTPTLRDHMLQAMGADTDEQVLPWLSTLCAAYLDQGIAYWSHPESAGLWKAGASWLEQGGASPDPFWRALRGRLAELGGVQADPSDVLQECLKQVQVPSERWAEYLSKTWLRLPGWSGMVHKLEQRPDLAPIKAPPVSLVDFSALWLVAERVAADLVSAGDVGNVEGESSVGTDEAARLPESQEERAFILFQLAVELGWTTSDVEALPASAVRAWLADLEELTGPARQRIWHEAYERSYRTGVFDALQQHVQSQRRRAPATGVPRFQVVTCIDDREESLRRHLEELSPEVETFGAAGFYNVAMLYQGAGDDHAQPLCPAPITPRHRVVERSSASAGAPAWVLELRTWRYEATLGSHTLVRGAFVTTVLGVLWAVALVMGVLFPRAWTRLHRRLGTRLQPDPETDLALCREGDARDPEGLWLGFSLDEMTDIVASVLEDIGLTSSLSPLILVVGHGSSSANNPHAAAYNCGACGGGVGGPNARAFASMANHPKVRAQLRARGVDIPATTHFVGALHDTCDDDVWYYDPKRLPETHREDLDALRELVDRARALDAHERCRRFEHASLQLTPQRALEHVEGRAEDLAQPRPELGHATNSMCIVGPRRTTRGLFLDRRAFLVSYEPSGDDDGERLRRILLSVVPVGAGINLEYYFSTIDPVKYGSGSKLPHNVTGLLGVLNGTSGDLRTGLPWQMVEIHRPVRMVSVIEAPRQRVEAVLAAEPGLRGLVERRWVHTAVLDPTDGSLWVWEDDGLIPHVPRSQPLIAAPTSQDLYRGRRDDLPVAQIAAALREARACGGRAA